MSDRIEQYRIVITKTWDPDAPDPADREVITTKYPPDMGLYDAAAMLGFAFVTCPQDFAKTDEEDQ